MASYGHFHMGSLFDTESLNCLISLVFSIKVPDKLTDTSTDSKGRSKACSARANKLI